MPLITRSLLHLSAAILAGLLVLLPGRGLGLHSARADGPVLAIDAGIDGNAPTALGPIENCVAVKNGDKFQVDITVRDITDLLAFSIYIDYDPSIVVVVDQDAKLFQQANAGSSVIDLSARIPDDSGLHAVEAFDSADPPAPDNGGGVLARITFQAVGAGDSAIRFGNRDIDADGVLDRGTLLKNSQADPIGDISGDTFFDGERDDARVVVDGDCPPGSTVGKAQVVSTHANDSSSFPWLAVSGGTAAAVVLVGGIGAGLMLFRRRSAARRTPPVA
jgi:hypothetical protein